MRSQPGDPRPGDFCLVTVAPWYVNWGIRIGEALYGDGFTEQVRRADGSITYVGFSHAFVVIGPDQVIEAEPGGARLAALAPYRDNCLGGKFVSSSWDLTDGQRDLICANAYRHLKRPYSELDYFALAAKRLHIPVPGLRTYIADSGHEICSQQVDDIYLESDLHMFDDGRWPGYVTPMGLFAALAGPVTKPHQP